MSVFVWLFSQSGEDIGQDVDVISDMNMCKQFSLYAFDDLFEDQMLTVDDDDECFNEVTA